MFTIRVEVTHHFPRIEARLKAIGDAVATLKHGQDKMNIKLTAAIAALQTEVTESTGKLASIATYLRGVPELVAAAVAQALADNDVSEDAAAATIEEARQTASDAVDSTLLAIQANPAEGEGDPAPADPAPVEEDPGTDEGDDPGADAGTDEPEHQPV